MDMSENLDNQRLQFLKEFSTLFADILLDDKAREYRLKNAEGLNYLGYQVLVAPRNEPEVEKVVSFCQLRALDYSLFSGGHNWGYGTAFGSQAHTVGIDLSQMCQILDFDEELGLVTIEPGVSQQQLAEFLVSQNSKWMVPTTGAGPTGNILGNALEKGFGLNVINDHFQACISLKVFIPAMGFYQSRLSELGASKSDLVSKWKLGPYFEGLFAQSNLGIVTQATLQLGAKPRGVNLLMVTVSKSKLRDLVDFCQEIHWRFQGSVFAINISNKQRLEATLNQHFEDSPKGRWEKRLIEKIGLHFDDYQVIIPLPVYNRASKVVHSEIRRLAKAQGLMTKWLPSRELSFIRRVIQFFNLQRRLPGVYSLLQDVLNLAGLIKGIPSDFALKLAYYTVSFDKSKDLDPAINGVGILWFAPILRLKFDDIDRVIQICDEVLDGFDCPKLYTFTNFDQKLVEATIPIFLNPKDPESVKKGYQCWEMLFSRCRAVGISPYRVPVGLMSCIQGHSDQVGARLYRALKQCCDPQNLQQAGRYEWGTPDSKNEKID